MLKSQVVIGGTYTAKVSDQIVVVKITREVPLSYGSLRSGGGWEATNLATGRTVRIRSAARLRAPVPKKATK